jgi:AcrR family transcriptional regulator
MARVLLPASTSARTASPDVRARVLSAALKLFAEHGFEGTTIQQIADTLGVTKAALYYHFESPKDEILAALIAPATEGLDSLLEEYEARPRTPASRRRFAEAYIDLMLGQRELIGYMSSDLAVLSHPAVAAGHRARHRRLEAMLMDDAVSFKERIRVTMALKGIVGTLAQNPEADAAELREALVEVAVLLLRGRPRPRNARPESSLPDEAPQDQAA